MYCHYEAVHADRQERRIRLNQVEEEDMKKRQMQMGIELVDDEPRHKKMRSDSECSYDSDIMIRHTFVVSSDSESDCIPDSKNGLVVKQSSPPQSPSKEMNGNYASPANKTTISQLFQIRHNGSPAKEHAPSLSNLNIQPKVSLENSFRNVPGLFSNEFTRPAQTNYNVQVGVTGRYLSQNA